MTSGELFALPLHELVAVARKGLQGKDIGLLEQLDAAFHRRFFDQVDEGTEDSKKEFCSAILAVVESEEAREYPRPEPVQQLFTKWQHLDVMLDALRHDPDLAQDARRLVETREHGLALLREVGMAGDHGITAGDLATRLGISRPHLAKLLREFEADDIIERHPAGRHVYVSLGIIGQLLAEQHAPALRDRDIREAVLVIPASSPCLVPIDFRPRELLAIQ